MQSMVNKVETYRLYVCKISALYVPIYIYVCSLQFECKNFSVSDRVSISPYIIICFTKSRFLKMLLIFLKLHKHNPIVLVNFRVSIIISLYINYLFPKKKLATGFCFRIFDYISSDIIGLGMAKWLPCW